MRHVQYRIWSLGWLLSETKSAPDISQLKVDPAREVLGLCFEPRVLIRDAMTPLIGYDLCRMSLRKCLQILVRYSDGAGNLRGTIVVA